MAVALDRRRFLKASAGLALGLGLAQVPGRVAAGAAPHAPSAPPAAGDGVWQELARSLQGTLLRPGDPDYARIARPWNLRFASILPNGIARCVSTDDVRTCLQWAQAHGVPLVARSGGHSYAGYSQTTDLMIDLSPMNQVTYDAKLGLAHMSGGARNSDVYASLRTVGRTVTHGRCAGVGVGGLVLGGGLGFNQRRLGLLCDQLVETVIVTAAGELLRCNDQENADLFWACRGGGGGNFGINTAFTFQTFPAETLTVYLITWTANLDALVPAALDLLPTTPERLGCKLSVVNDGTRLSLELLGQLVGPPDELRALLAPLYRLATPAGETVRVTSYWDGQDFLSEDSSPEYTHERSRYVYQPLSAEGARTILSFMRRWPGTRADATWKIFLAGGTVTAVPPDATAFVHRGAQMVSSIELDWTPDDTVGTVADNEAWLAEFHAAMAPFTSDESYQNFIDEAQSDYLRAYYGANLERLVAVKRRYDPQNVFRFPQSIPLAL
ncbi:MAG TPA: FAD-binding oxidoreductase [Chloroflexota bacterium]|nr:FAD-binding oxidoreductase [Chloroflexota bacterium]